MEEKKKINLTAKNLLRYGEIVLTKEWKSPAGLVITERYIIWDTVRMNGETDPDALKKANNRKKMYTLTMTDGQVITMKQV